MRCCLAVIALVALGTDASGQAPTASSAAEPASIPTELARALVSGPFGEMAGPPRFFLGAPPGGLPGGVTLPAGTRIVGGQSGRRSTTTVLATSGSADAVVDSIRAMLARGGWTAPPRESRSGFVSTDYLGPGDFLCRDSSVVMVFRAGGRSSTYVAVMQRRSERFDVCTARPPHDRYVPDLEIPSLTPPAGARAIGSGGGGGGNEVQASVRLETALGADALIAHYSRQLVAAGWKVGATVPAADLAVAAVIARDRRGQEWRGVLTALSWPADSMRVVELRMMRPDER